MRSGKINVPIIIKMISKMLVIEGLFIWLALPFALYYNTEAYTWGFFKDLNHEFPALLVSGALSIVIGLVLSYITRNADNTAITKREGYFVVSLAWVVISSFGALPFFISGYIPSYTDAFFETMSGFTTTGSSILTDIESIPKGLLFWRSMTHWIGGMGIIVLSLAILPILGIGGMQMFAAEVPGPIKDKLHPRIKDTAKRLWGIYVLLTFVQTVLLMFGGLDFFDSICHAFATMATGGFSTQNASVANYSPYIQYVIILFMILAGVNFSLHYLALHGKLKKVLQNEEFRYYLSVLFGFSIIISCFLIINAGMPIEKAFRDALFQVVSIVTTTGFVTADYLMWPGYLWIIIFLLMFVGGSTGSTGGGVKVMRHVILFKNSGLELKRLIHPKAIIPVRFNGKSVPQDIVFNILAFFMIYMIIFGLSMLVMIAVGLDFQTAIGSVAASLGNIGPGIGKVGPVENYSAIPIVGKWFLSFLMLLGRLELFTVLIILSPSFYKK
ncbi:MAG: TrkH family potassium uptake protein [Bacteroidales bacterium]|nr:TrkH family potassium uptake protein [Bacteroidales bacterium]